MQYVHAIQKKGGSEKKLEDKGLPRKVVSKQPKLHQAEYGKCPPAANAAAYRAKSPLAKIEPPDKIRPAIRHILI